MQSLCYANHSFIHTIITHKKIQQGHGLEKRYRYISRYHESKEVCTAQDDGQFLVFFFVETKTTTESFATPLVGAYTPDTHVQSSAFTQTHDVASCPRNIRLHDDERWSTSLHATDVEYD